MKNKIVPKSPKINFLVKSIEENRCLSKTIINYFKVIHLYLSLDFGFMKFRSLKARVILKLINVIQCIFVCVISFISILTTPKNTFMGVWYICYTIEYFLFVIVLSFFKCDKSFYDLQNDLLAIDSEIGTDSHSYNLEFKIIFWSTVVVLERFIYSYFFCYLSNGDALLLTLFIIFYIPPYLTNDVIMVIYMFSFYSVSCRVMKFIDFVQKNISDIVSCEYIYKSMIDSTQKAMKIFEVLFIICFLCNTPQVMMTVYFVLALIKNNDIGGISEPPLYISAAVAIIQAMILIFLPSYFAGKLLSHTDKLKMTLHNILLHETDAIRSRDLKRFIRYIEARPFKFTVCKIIPMDWTFPVLILNISITYLIVAIQFTKLY